MSHPFELELSDLEAVELSFEEQLTFEDAGKVQGGFGATTNYATVELGEAGEEGGGGSHPIPKPIPTEIITAARGGESGEGGGGVTTNAVTAWHSEAGEGGGYVS